MFFDRFKKLCDERGISTYKACTDIGLNRSAVAKWKNGGQPNGSTAARLADYFGVTTDYLLGKEKSPANSDERDILDEVDIGFYKGFKELTDEQKETVRDMVKLMRQRRASQKE